MKMTHHQGKRRKMIQSYIRPRRKEFSISSDCTIQVDNLNEFIESTIKDKTGRSTKSCSSYTNPTCNSGCLLDFNLQNFNNLLAMAIPSNISRTLWKPITMLTLKVICLLSNLFTHRKVTPSIGTRI